MASGAGRYRRTAQGPGTDCLGCTSWSVLRRLAFWRSSGRRRDAVKEPSRNNLDVYLTVVLLFFGRSEVSTFNLFLDGS